VIPVRQHAGREANAAAHPHRGAPCLLFLCGVPHGIAHLWSKPQETGKTLEAPLALQFAPPGITQTRTRLVARVPRHLAPILNGSPIGHGAGKQGADEFTNCLVAVAWILLQASQNNGVEFG
jgi:hypothetical protein